jgi:hypothetical protein
LLFLVTDGIRFFVSHSPMFFKSLISTILLSYWVASFHAQAQDATNLKKFSVTEAKQAVAVDKNHFYVINNSTIQKYEKLNGKLVASWDGKKEGIKHLNSGVVIKGKMYCANSNYPEIPMASSVEIFDVTTLTHVGSHSFGISNHGSLTWLDQYQGFWYIGFAHYAGKDASEGRDVRWTSLVKYNLDWIETEAWVFPKNIIEAFTPKSNSGGAIGPDGKLYLTGHDKPELYLLQIPKTGYTLNYLKTIPTSIHGQGVAIDPAIKDKVVIYGINRETNTVLVEEIK